MRKEIRRRSGQTREEYDKAFRNEHNCLLFLDRLAHPNIIPLLGSYTYGEKHNFLFPSYKMDLRTFLRIESRFGDFGWDFTFFSALRGLASALCSTHKLYLEKAKHGLDINAIGYHHDLRPANVLISEETFILADFGLGNFKSADASSQTLWKVGEGDYLAPECMDKNHVHQNVGRAVDIWAFGCLMIEVVIYMEKGAASLKEFRKLRMSPSRCEGWEDSCFYDNDGRLKSIVLQWLDSVTHDLLRPSPVHMLVNVSRKALKRKPEDRSKMEDICANLTVISLKAHLITVREHFQKYIERYIANKTAQTTNQMKIWFGSERLAAFDHVICSDSVKTMPLFSSTTNSRYDDFIKTLKAMAVQFREVDSVSFPVKPDAIRGPENSTENSKRSIERVENDICKLVESLWNLLPTNEQEKAEAAWLRAILDTEDVRRLNDVEQAFKSEDDPIYEKGAAMAMMKRIGLSIKSNPTSMPESFIVSENDVQRLRAFRHHELGLFKGMLVLIEWMTYSSGWENVSPEQRAIMMSLKAEGFSNKTERADMRMLGCIGTFEDTGEKPGYGFLHRVPICDPQADINSSIATLLQLVENKNCQPLLGSKLWLASALAQFLGDFHNIGWLHKNFYSNNIIFFDVKKSEQESSVFLSTQALQQLYVVGFHESRLGGQYWDTAGSASNADFQDYQHPEYARTKRYRATYDYYSLGLILLELGLWQPLRVWATRPSCRKMGLVALRKDLIETWVPFLGIKMGAVYRNVVHFCLSGSMDSSEDLDISILEAFAKNVIEPLKDLAEAHI